MPIFGLAGEIAALFIVLPDFQRVWQGGLPHLAQTRPSKVVEKDNSLSWSPGSRQEKDRYREQG
jgi:hypothetical protein